MVFQPATRLPHQRRGVAVSAWLPDPSQLNSRLVVTTTSFVFASTAWNGERQLPTTERQQAASRVATDLSIDDRATRSSGD